MCINDIDNNIDTSMFRFNRIIIHEVVIDETE